VGGSSLRAGACGARLDLARRDGENEELELLRQYQEGAAAEETPTGKPGKGGKPKDPNKLSVRPVAVRDAWRPSTAPVPAQKAERLAMRSKTQRLVRETKIMVTSVADKVIEQKTLDIAARCAFPSDTSRSPTRMHRVAATLKANLSALAGPTSTEL
jgi:hypothetical protein